MAAIRALQLSAPGKFEIVELDKPVPGEGEVLVKLEAASICNQHDIRQWRGEAGRYPTEPGFPGHEGAGVIIEVGQGVKGLEIGDRIVTSGIGGEPLYREYFLRKADAVAKITDNEIPFEHLAPLELFGCVRHAVEHAAELADMRVGVAGLGPAGLAAVMLLRLEAPRELIGIDLLESRREAGIRVGASRTLDGAAFSGLHDALKRKIEGKSAPGDEKIFAAALELDIDVLFDCTGSAAALETSFLLPERELVIFGYVPREARCIQAAWFQRELVIKSSKILSLANLRTVANLTSGRLLNPGMLVTHTLPFKRYAEALELVASGEAVKIALKWE